MGDARPGLPAVGAFVGFGAPAAPAERQRDAIRRVENAGFAAAWTNEIIGTDALVRASLWLGATERLVVGTCIANVWARPAPTAHAAASALHEAFPGRFVLGLGTGNRDQAAAVGRDYGSPLATAGGYLEQLADRSYPAILAANGDRMLALAGELADGALPAGQDAGFTERARARLGADKLLAVYLALDAAATPASVADAVDGHLAAGADHVVLGMSFLTELDVVVDRLEQLGPTLTKGRG